MFLSFSQIRFCLLGLKFIDTALLAQKKETRSKHIIGRDARLAKVQAWLKTFLKLKKPQLELTAFRCMERRFCFLNTTFFDKKLYKACF